MADLLSLEKIPFSQMIRKGYMFQKFKCRRSMFFSTKLMNWTLCIFGFSFVKQIILK